MAAKKKAAAKKPAAKKPAAKKPAVRKRTTAAPAAKKPATGGTAKAKPTAREMHATEMLAYVRKNPGSSVADVAKAQGVSAGTLYPVARDLLDAGKVKKTGSKYSVAR